MCFAESLTKSIRDCCRRWLKGLEELSFTYLLLHYILNLF